MTTAHPNSKESVLFRVAAVQMVSTPDWPTNRESARVLIAEAAKRGANLVLLPEYFCFMGHRDTDKLALREAPGQGPIQDFLAEQAAQHGIYLVGGTVPLVADDPEHVFNTSLVFGPSGQAIARYDKVHLFSFHQGNESYDEGASIQPGRRIVGFDTPIGRVGLAVCYDLRFPELFRAEGDVALWLLPAAFTATTGKAHWEILLRARAIENQCYVLASAQGGHHPNGRDTWGHSLMIDPWGVILDELPDGEGVICADLDLARLAQVRGDLPALQHRVFKS